MCFSSLDPKQTRAPAGQDLSDWIWFCAQTRCNNAEHSPVLYDTNNLTCTFLWPFSQHFIDERTNESQLTGRLIDNESDRQPQLFWRFCFQPAFRFPNSNALWAVAPIITLCDRDGARLLKDLLSAGFWACQHYHLLFLHPNQEMKRVSILTWVFWIWRGWIKASRGGGTWPLGPINASSNLNFSRPPLIFKRPVSSISSALSTTTDVRGHNSIAGGNVDNIKNIDGLQCYFKGI